jgi:hypothetical protein
MPFAQANFQPVGGQSKRGNAPQVFSYQTADAFTDIDTAGYFNSIRAMLSPCDLIHVVRTSSGVPVGYGLYVVRSVSATSVDVFNTINSVASLANTD